MNSLLAAKRPKDISKEDWEKMWNNSHYLLQPFADVMKAMLESRDTVKGDDFDCPNHYAKLAYELGQKEMLKQLLNILPPTVQK